MKTNRYFIRSKGTAYNEFDIHHHKESKLKDLLIRNYKEQIT